MDLLSEQSAAVGEDVSVQIYLWNQQKASK